MIFAILNGLSVGAALFLVAAGLTFVFGILRVLNFAHGHFFMIGAYVTFSILGRETGSIGNLILASLAGGLAVGVLGVITDFLVLRRLRHVDHSYMMIGTFALLMVCSGGTKLIWGLETYAILPPAELAGRFRFPGFSIDHFSLFVIGVGIAMFVLLEVAIHRLWIGKVLLSLSHDPWMSGILGLRVPALFAGAVVSAFFLAGLAGGLLLPFQSLSSGLAISYLLHAFIACIIGGLGNVRGAFIASMLMGLVESVSQVMLPNAPGLAIYVLMAAFLLWKPNGLFGEKVA